MKAKSKKSAVNHKRIRTVYLEAEEMARGMLDHLRCEVSKVKHRVKGDKKPTGNYKLVLTARLLEEMLGEKVTIGSFNLPAIVTCPGAMDCMTYCYAMQGRFAMSRTQAIRFRNLISLKECSDMVKLLTKEFISWIVGNVGDDGVAVLRLHDSGDFFSQEYVNAVAEAVERTRGMLPALLDHDVKFIPYAYTKSLNLDLSPLVSAGVRLTQSHGGKFDHLIDESLPIAQVFAKGAGIPDGWIDGQSEEYADTLAILGHKRIALSYHGNATQPDLLRDRRVELYQIAG